MQLPVLVGPAAATPEREPASDPRSDTSSPPLICFSHLRWDFVTQRPQHLMRRFARHGRVFFWEEHIPCDHPLPYLEFHPFASDGIIALRPRLPHWWDAAAVARGLRDMLDLLVAATPPEKPVLWFYSPVALRFAGHLRAAAIVYDCMDELAAFRFADPALRQHEAELIRRADVMFTGGHSLYEARRALHGNIHPLPSAVDAAHFAPARGALAAPDDQRGIAAPRLGYFGVIDERLDLALIDAVAARRPDWSVVMIGPVVKIDPRSLPSRPNIHWLGQRAYADLPAYLAGWDVALMPFAINEATRFISPTKTPEYLSGGRAVVSTPITDVVRSYGALEGVKVAAGPEAFIAACEAALALPRPGAWLREADRLLARQSWDATFRDMEAHLSAVVEARRAAPAPSPAPAPSAPVMADPTPAAPVLAANDIDPPPARRPVRRGKECDVLVVGAGFAGAVLAERLAAGAGRRVLLIDRRPHIGGNAYDHLDAAGILVHRYGPHIFHTNSHEVFDYLSRFTAWRPYEHRVLAQVRGRLVPVPINRTTLNLLYGLDLRDEAQAAAFLAARAEPRADIRNSEDVVVSAVGRELYELFFRGYTRKQWGLDPAELDRSVTARVPTRTTDDDRYFLDRYQAMPASGFTRLFENMLDHERIALRLGVDYRDLAGRVAADHTIYTGPIDEYFDHRFGQLPYRSLQFRHETLPRERLQPVAVVNHPDESVPFTRITEYKHLTGQSHRHTSVSHEYPSAEGDPYYPIPRAENEAMYRRYAALADATPAVSFVGRLATYRYYNMDQVVAQALATYRRLVSRADGRLLTGAVT